MASFDEHYNRSISNLNFLEEINKIEDYWDWKVVICFYVATHLMNAHILKKANHHSRKHSDINKYLNPYKLSPCKLSEINFCAYESLYSLSRRARYLVNENLSDTNPKGYFTYDKHFKKSIVHLDSLMKFFESEYHNTFPKKKIKCLELKNIKLNYFEVTS